MQKDEAEDEGAVVGDIVFAQFFGDAAEGGAFVRLPFQVSEHEESDIRHRCLKWFVLGYEHSGWREELLLLGVGEDIAAEEFVGKQVGYGGHVGIAPALMGFRKEPVDQ